MATQNISLQHESSALDWPFSDKVIQTENDKDVFNGDIGWRAVANLAHLLDCVGLTWFNIQTAG
jgi:hypothetical protein